MLPRFSALTWRILAFNALALIVLTGGVILVQSSGRGLVEERLTPACSSRPPSSPAPSPNMPPIETGHALKVDAAEPLLRQLIAPTRLLRARLYLPAGQLRALDTRYLLPAISCADQRAAAARHRQPGQGMAAAHL